MTNEYDNDFKSEIRIQNSEIEVNILLSLPA